jgi:hypothetical protein
MSPIHHLATVPAGTTPVSSLNDKRRQRRRLEHLLDVRSGLARTVSEKRSHRLDDAEFLAGIQAAVEATILDEFPAVYHDQFSHWMVQEAADGHPVGVLTPGCSICQAIASERGINLTAPDAA